MDKSHFFTKRKALSNYANSYLVLRDMPKHTT